MEYQRLSVRRGIREPEPALFEGVPAHLVAPLIKWCNTWIYENTSQGEQLAIASRLRIPITDRSVYTQIMTDAQEDPDLWLDLVDLSLAMAKYPQAAEGLASILVHAGSLWRVSESGRGLQQRVSDAESAAMKRVVTTADQISEDLAIAWSKVYGREPDPDDAWDHAIKAVEGSLIPLIVPKQDKANLGHVAGALKSAPTKYTSRITSSGAGDPAATLENMLRLMWPNPGRHGGSSTPVPISIEEAENIVQLAVLIAGWVRSGAIQSV